MPVSQDKVTWTRLEVDERRKRWLEKKIGGMSYPAIAAEEGMHNLRAIQKQVKKYLERYHTPTAEAWRAIQAARLEKLIEVHWPKALEGDKDATATVLKLIERECRLMGLDLTQETPLVQQINQILISYQQSQDWRLQAEEGEEAPALPAESGDMEPKGADAD